MRGQCDERQHSDEYGIPVEDAGMGAEFEVGPERFEEVAGGIERHSAHDVAERRAEKHAEQNARNCEDDIEESLPERGFNVSAKFNADGAQHEQPQNHHERKIKSAEA